MKGSRRRQWRGFGGKCGKLDRKVGSLSCGSWGVAGEGRLLLGIRGQKGCWLLGTGETRNRQRQIQQRIFCMSRTIKRLLRSGVGIAWLADCRHKSEGFNLDSTVLSKREGFRVVWLALPRSPPLCPYPDISCNTKIRLDTHIRQNQPETLWQRFRMLGRVPSFDQIESTRIGSRGLNLPCPLSELKRRAS